MSNINFLPSDTRFESITRRVSLSLFLFTGVLVGALFVSKQFLFPRLTQVEVYGQVRDLKGIQQYHSELAAELLQAESKRNMLILPIQDELYQVLLSEKHAQIDFLSTKDRIDNIASRFSSDGGQSVFLYSVSYQDNDHVIEVVGDVQNVGFRSMTVLAQFVEAIRDLPFVSSVENPRFVRKHTDDKGNYSPFTIRLVL